MESEDKRVNQLTQIASAPANGIIPIDVPGSTAANGITVANLFKGCFSIQSTFEGDLDYLRTPGMYYTTGHTQNSFGTGLLVVFASSISVMQFSVNVFTGSFACRSLLFNDGKLDKWTDWRLISFT